MNYCQFTAGVIAVITLIMTHAYADAVSPTDKYAWSENAGWLNFDPTHAQAAVYDDHLEGYVWSEGIGWIRLGSYSGGGDHTYSNNTASSYGVNHDGNGSLSGYAWSENGGWINFNPSHSQVTIDPVSGDFNGYAWSESVGWISFQGAGPIAYKVRVEPTGTSFTDSDGDGTPDSTDAFPDDPGETTDSDGDGTGDNADEFPNDASETADTDGDGVGDNADAFPTDPLENTDSDGDGIGDNGDASNATDDVGISLINAPASCSFNGPVSAATLDPANAPGAPIDIELSFQIDDCGSTVTIEAHFGDPLPEGSVAYKHGTDGDWIEIPGAVINGNTITYDVADGGPLDADGAVNGSISDPITALVPALRGSGQPIPALPLWGLVLCVAALVGIARRRLV